MQKIVLSGYMGSGKTSVGESLSAMTNITLIDLDQQIEQKTGLSIAGIFASKGEIFFRRLEHEALKEVLAYPDPCIISLGGGTPCYAGNDQLLLNSKANWVYLKALPETLFQRLTADAGKRPLLEGKTPAEIQESIAKNLFDRSHYYNLAPFKISTDGKSIHQVALEIKDLLT